MLLNPLASWTKGSKFISRFSLFSVIGLSTVFSGCGSGQGLGPDVTASGTGSATDAAQVATGSSQAASQPAVKAPDHIAQAFASVADEAVWMKEDRAQLVIQTVALEKEFLLQASVIAQAPVPMGSGIKSRVVSFRKKGKNLYLLESSQGHLVDFDLPQNLVLAEFPILEETAEGIRFDFNAGMSQLFGVSDWVGHDMDGIDYDSATQFKSTQVRASFIDKIEMTADNTLVVRQVAQLTGAKGMEVTNTPVEVRYYLSPYRPDATYKAVKAKGFDRVGFFEVAPQLKKDGNTALFATRFHPEKPIVYAISANTPKDYKQAVKDGILYWNKAFGKEVVQVVEAPAGVTAPDPRYNLVQWVNWDQAGFAYADAQMDPRTGEILHAQVYLTSAFAFGGKERARSLLRQLGMHSEAATTSRTRVGLKGFGFSALCDRHQDQALTDALTDLLDSGASDAMILRASQDYVREVAAHEIGHTLGLRHNFAGSLASNLPLSKRAEVVRDYLQKDTLPEGLVVSSSVMEYEIFEESLFSAVSMRKPGPALDYDQKAIAILYQGKKYANKEMPLFCTDSHTEDFVDCTLFDTGASALEYAEWQVGANLERLPARLLNWFIFSKAQKESEDVIEPDQVQLPDNTSDMAKQILASRAAVLKSLTAAGNFLKIQRTFSTIDPQDRETVRKSETAYVESELQRLGGVAGLLKPISQSFAESMGARFNALLEKYKAGVVENGVAYSFSEQELATIRSKVQGYLKKLQSALVKQELEVLAENAKGQAGKFIDHPMVDTLVSFLYEQAKTTVLSTTGEFTVVEVEVPGETAGTSKMVTVKLPQFVYPLELRLQAAELLEDKRGVAIDWALVEREKLKKQIADLISEVLPDSVSKIKNHLLPKAVRRWAMEMAKF